MRNKLPRPVSATLVFSQDADSCSDGEFQTLEVVIENAGGGCYPILKTERWALDTEELTDFARLIRWCVGLCRDTFDEEPK